MREKREGRAPRVSLAPKTQAREVKTQAREVNTSALSNGGERGTIR